MSIIMLVSDSSSFIARTRDQVQQLDPNLRSLLDHIAVELAQEYIRLMEVAAEAETLTRDPAG